MRKPRDFKAEYARRIERATTRGLSRSQARGHPRSGEGYASARGPPKPAYDGRLEEALRRLRRFGGSASAVAKEAGVSRERFTRYIQSVAGAYREGQTWRFQDQRIREITIVEAGQYHPVTIRVRGFEPAHEAGLHFHEAGLALDDQSRFEEFVRRWEGRGVRDVTGKFHPFSTALNHLYAAVLAQDYSFERFYRIEQ